jgi:hypothetical protein
MAASDPDDGQDPCSLLGLRDLDAESLCCVPEASVLAVQALEILTQAHDGCQVHGVE